MLAEVIYTQQYYATILRNNGWTCHIKIRQKRHQRGWGVGALKCHSRVFSRNNPNTTIPVRAMGVGSRWQGRVIPLWPEKFFHFDH